MNLVPTVQSETNKYSQVQHSASSMMPCSEPGLLFCRLVLEGTWELPHFPPAQESVRGHPSSNVATLYRSLSHRDGLLTAGALPTEKNNRHPPFHTPSQCAY